MPPDAIQDAADEAVIVASGLSPAARLTRRQAVAFVDAMSMRAADGLRTE